jgi:dihydrofolate reductase
MKAIVAMTSSRVIGYKNRLPWRVKDDLRWFKGITMGHPVLMGRKTFESIGRPLPGRRNLVASRSAEFPGTEIIRDLDAFDPTGYRPEVFVIGGAEIYQQLLARLEEIWVTCVNHEYAGDSFFPEFEHLFERAETLAKTSEYERIRYRRMGT